MTYEQLKQGRYILLDCVSGSHAYNLHLPTSDIDKKGIFILPQKRLYGFDYFEQVNNSTNDEVYFEIKRFLELLTKNNPNILELLNTPAQFVLYKHPLMNLIRTEDFLSKLCFDTFAGYAQIQIKKAKGLNKKINKPVEKQRKSVLDFCYVIYKNGSVPLIEWLSENHFVQQECGLAKVDHFRDGYLLYHKKQLKPGEWFKGIVSGNDTDEVQVSIVPKDTEPLATMNFNKDGYSTYCKEYKEYKEWEDKRNPIRYENTLSHGKNYDSKNMMHTFRLLNMAEEIAMRGEIMVYREDREFLLKIRSGEFEFNNLMVMVAEKMEKLKELYAKSDLPQTPDIEKAENLLVRIREEFY